MIVLHPGHTTTSASRITVQPVPSENLDGGFAGCQAAAQENKKPMGPADWKNGLKGRHLYLTPH